MKMKSLTSLFCLIVAAVSSQSASALVMIDDFSSGNANMSISGGNQTAFANGTMSGGDRMMYAQITGNIFGLSFDVDAQTGTLSVTSQSGVDGLAQFGYGYQPVGPGAGFDDMNLNLSAESAFNLMVLSNDQPTSFTISVRSTQQNPSSLITVTQNLPGGNVNTPNLLTFNFSAFTGFDFSDVDQILVEINPTNSGDVTVDWVAAVPEPTSMFAIAAGAAFLAARRRRK